MSGGEQQMCAIGRALMARPKLLMLDEPSMGLAPIFVEKIFETVVAINSEGTPILLVEQNALMALDVAKRAYVMETGRIALEGPRASSRRTSRYARPTSARVSVPTRSGAYGGATARRRERARRQAVRHLERARDRVARDEAECARRGGVAASGDDDPARGARARAGSRPSPRAAGAGGTSRPAGIADRSRRRRPRRARTSDGIGIARRQRRRRAVDTDRACRARTCA
jgi:hypothetical protein